MTTRQARRDVLPRLLFAASLALFTALVFEAGIRWTGLDMVALRPLLYYQNSDPEVHELSTDPALIYRLKPGARTIGRGRDGPLAISVNDLGFRDPPRSARKPAGVFRIFCVGLSHVYGAEVGDRETLPRQLEGLLNRSFRGRFEVWNAGVSAYVALQETAYAREIAARLAPDLIVVQLDRLGRRAFLLGRPFAQFFRADPRLYLENLVLVPFGHDPFAARLLGASALYRTAVIYLNYPLMLGRDAGALQGRYVEDANLRAVAEFFMGAAPDLPKVMLVFRPYGGWDPRTPAPPTIELYASRFAPPVLPPEYFRIHPDGHVYRLQAQVIAEELSAWFPQALRKKVPGERLVEVPRASVPAGSFSPEEVAELSRVMRAARCDRSLAAFQRDLDAARDRRR